MFRATARAGAFSLTAQPAPNARTSRPGGACTAATLKTKPVVKVVEVRSPTPRRMRSSHFASKASLSAGSGDTAWYVDETMRSKPGMPWAVE
jgi:hypothetical protein